MFRRLNRAVSLILSVAFIAVSTGFDAQRAAAQTIAGRSTLVSPMRQLSKPPPSPWLANAPTPNLAFPALSLSWSAPMLAAPSASTRRWDAAASVAETVAAVAPALAALSQPSGIGSAASVAGRDMEDALTGARSVRLAGDIVAVVGAESAATLALSRSLSAASASEAPKTNVPAASPASDESLDWAASYRFYRWALKTVAAMTGAVFTLPQAGATLTAKIVGSAADKRAVFSDYDDTLAAYNEVLPSEMVDAIAAVRAAGKDFVVISDRGDEKRPGSTQLTVFESLASLPAQVRAGMYVAANSGGKVYLHDAQGVPQKVHEAPALVAEKLDAVAAAVAAAKARLPAVGAEQYAGDKTVPAESYSTYGYAMMLKVGSGEKTVRAAAAILQEELSSRGFDVEVNARFAKDPANPPYITFSIITKADSTVWIAKALKVEPQDALVVGDSMYVPREGKKANWMTRLGERLSGRPLAKTGNETDRNMAKGLPGVLALGVGANMDPRVPNGYALAGKGPAVTKSVLLSVASKPALAINPAALRPQALDSAFGEFVVWLIGAAAVAALYATIYWAVTSVPAVTPQGPEDWYGPIPSIDEIFQSMGGMFGLALAGLVKPSIVKNSPTKFSQHGSVAGLSVLAGMALVVVAAVSGVFMGLHLSAGILSGFFFGGALLTALIIVLDDRWAVLDWRWQPFNIAAVVTIFAAVSGLVGLIALGAKGLLG